MQCFDRRRSGHRGHHRPARCPGAAPGLNDRLGATLTRAVGTMWAFYVAALVMAAWIVLACIPGTPLHRWDPYPFTFLLFLGNIVQLLLMFVVLAGQRVLAVQAEEPEERRGSAEVLPGPGAGGASRPGPASRRPCTGSPVRRLSRLAPG